MLKIKYFLFLILLTTNIQFGLSQISFQESTSNSFPGVFGSGSAFFDADNDGDLDVIFSGFDQSTTRVTKLFINNSGSFTEDLNSNFTGIVGGDLDFGDIDNDNDLDLIIVGAQNGTLRIAKVYKNNSGVFTEDTNFNLEGTIAGSVELGDVDNDNDLDLLITGVDNTNTYVTLLYENDNGNFNLVPNTPFVNVGESSSAFGDVNNDGFLDVFVCGKDNSNNLYSNLYLNNNGVFSLDTTNIFEGLRTGDAVFGDVDNNGFLDLIVSGTNNNSVQITKLYKNNNGIFTEDSTNQFLGFQEGELALSDVNNNNFLDLMITGDVSGTPNTRLYSNINGVFTDENLNFTNVSASTVSFGDVDGDNDDDLFLTGTTSGASGALSKLYINQSTLSINSFNSSKFTLFPNPASEYLMFENQSNRLKSYTIYNEIGALVMRDELNSDNKIDVSSLSKGTYFIRFEENYTYKFIKE